MKLADGILREQVRLAYRQLPTMQTASFVVALVLAWLVRDIVPRGHIYAWVGMILAIAIGRFVIHSRFARVREGEFDAGPWVRVYLSTSLVSGIFWGLSAFIIFPAGEPALISLFVLVMASLSASTTISHSAVRLGPTLWAGPTMLLYAARCVLEGGEYGYSLGFLIVIYLVTILSYSFKTNRTITRSISLHFENLALLTESRTAVNALRESETRFKTLADATFEGIAVTEQGHYVDVNTRLTQILGYQRSELIGLDVAATLPPEERARVLANIMAGCERHIEHEMLCKDGSRRYVEAHGQSIAQGGRNLRITALRDITERKQIEGQLAVARDELESQVAERTSSLAIANEQLSREIEERKQTERLILEHQYKLKSLAFELSLAEERERGRIAGELHDQVGQQLLLGKMKLEELESLLPAAIDEGRLEEIGALIERSIQDIRSLTFQLRPPLLATAGLAAAIGWLGEELRENYGLQIALIDDRQPKPLKYETCSTLFQTVRELLLNVAKHAGTESTEVSLKREENSVVITVADYGAGFDLDEASARRAKAGGFGLFNVQQKIEYLGGRLVMDSAPGKGTRAVITVPLDHHDADRG